MRDDDKDWLDLNAYADGELGPAETARLDARLRADPGLRAELDGIHALKRQLQSFRPTVRATELPRPQRLSVSKKIAAGAIAAALVFFAIGVTAMLVWRNEETTWIARAAAMHDRLSHSAYVVDERHVEQIVSSGHTLEFRAPDLTASRLFLVDVVTAEPDGVETIAMHYRGMRGCRLTVVAMHGIGGPSELFAPDRLIRTWPYDGFNFAIVANGMDPLRFASVADYAKAAILEDVGRYHDLEVAMTERYNAARPCA